MTYKIAVIGGDGTGPEVVAEGLKVLKTVAKKYNISYELKEFDFSGKRYLKTGKLVDDADIAELKKYNAIYLGAVGDPEVKPGILEHGVLLKLRFALDQYINLRPVILYPNVYTPIKDKGPAEIDFVVVRENTEGLYASTGGYLRKGTPDEIATQVSVNTRKGVERCLRYAFEYTRKRNKRKQLTLVGKTNVLTFAFDLWERAFHEIGEKDYPDIKREYAHVDATCMWFVKNPEWFDVIVTDNMFGDIITDLGAMIQGGMGIAAGGNINPHGVSMFEPIGGSAPKYTGKNVINPLAAIGAMQLLLSQLGEEKAAVDIEQAIIKTVAKMPSQAAGKMGMGTKEVGDSVASLI
ncbi:3-isopropylmalate dehydrogenase [candidate division WOR-1 bacterium RIFOXYA12_FULL_52_29]|uniref:3-isopropylmalate dehydrogenase n=1 Tax=candidate division WOR-1 bacterium RIFOXYC12_FULL_54_18 TaxID=1802584 RepID=A0A1F4T9N5_UNCSA|nr:MAG: 3-isopropylmalate dehydrogenase [candidate division WOR-1 bacterium RIFOXYA2_FULL_51_19]OGC18356.1 MAG: 3-isopropylmalate dehydrogenase [candidate division WOR-1 bacterium RIFOXYA12_FULL_52_29]OGC27211.1 MAG: 3-isopropylmalate dehydrogenase [candidate division WOR-1 bacterium RIFOXYB2_FULL_45_9]OGC28773.1 MAG: 3-isopropylmalate dehydrogenase [candidate division WOR-1 bacterium RIFOXYC12_FULL_54_18]OGC30772.1 MAG: 3-isopropylmalate dehydrogenase [candidate division WOR-1 bacterium RIFOXY